MPFAAHDPLATDEVMSICHHLAEIYMNRYDLDEKWTEFFEINDLGIPLAILVTMELVTLSEESVELIDQSWNSALEVMTEDLIERAFEEVL